MQTPEVILTLTPEADPDQMPEFRAPNSAGTTKAELCQDPEDLLALNAAGQKHKIILFGPCASTASSANTPAAAVLLQMRDNLLQVRQLMLAAENPSTKLRLIRASQEILQDMWRTIFDVAKLQTATRQHNRALRSAREIARMRLSGPDPARHVVSCPINHDLIVTDPSLREALNPDNALPASEKANT